VDLLQAVASPRKREILRVLWDRERSAGDVCRAMGDVTFGAVSQHLRALEAAGFVERRAEGRFRYYRTRRRAVGAVASLLEAMWASALSELARRAELEEARRGPRSVRRRTRRSKR